MDERNKVNTISQYTCMIVSIVFLAVGCSSVVKMIAFQSNTKCDFITILGVEIFQIVSLYWSQVLMEIVVGNSRLLNEP